MALNAAEACVCNTDYYENSDVNGNTQCTLCPDGSTRNIESVDQSITGCGMFCTIIILIIKNCILFEFNYTFVD